MKGRIVVLRLACYIIKDIIFYILPNIEGSFDIISHSVSWGSGEGYILSPARNRQKFQIMKIHNFEGSIIPEDIWTKIDSISLEDFVGAAYFLP